MFALVARAKTRQWAVLGNCRNGWSLQVRCSACSYSRSLAQAGTFRVQSCMGAGDSGPHRRRGGGYSTSEGSWPKEAVFRPRVVIIIDWGIAAEVCLYRAEH